MNVSSNNSAINSSDYQYEISYYDYNDVWSKDDLLSFGLICMIPILCGLPIYVFVLYMFTTKPEFNSELTYRMMVYYGLADMLQMCYYISWAAMCISDSSFSFTISMIICALQNSVWTLVNLMIFLISFIRFDIFIKIPINFDRKIVFNIIALIFVMIALTQFTIGLFPRFRVFSRSPLGITYQIGAAQIYWYFAWTNYVALGIAIILYFVSFISIVIKRRVFMSSSTALLTKLEIRMLIQTVVPCLVKTILSVYLDFIIPSSNSKLGEEIINFVMFLEASYTPYLYLLANSALRIRIKQLFKEIHMFKDSSTNIVVPIFVADLNKK